jgi:TusA-related sulfurtransferase
VELNAKGLKCPMPIIKISAAVRQLAVGEEVRVVADDRGFPPDVRAWCAKTGQELVSLDENNPAELVAVIRKVS